MLHLVVEDELNATSCIICCINTTIVVKLQQPRPPILKNPTKCRVLFS